MMVHFEENKLSFFWAFIENCGQRLQWCFWILRYLSQKPLNGICYKKFGIVDRFWEFIVQIPFPTDCRKLYGKCIILKEVIHRKRRRTDVYPVYRDTLSCLFCLSNHAVLHRSKNRLRIMFMERGSCMRDSLSYLIPSWITANFCSLVRSNS